MCLNFSVEKSALSRAEISCLFTDQAAMVYVTVKEETEQKLHFSREPSNNSWALLIG